MAYGKVKDSQPFATSTPHLRQPATVDNKQPFNIKIDVANYAAAGTSATDATQLPDAPGFNITSADDSAGVILPDSDVGTMIFVHNAVSNKNLLVYPDSGSTLNGGTATTGSITVADGTSAWFWRTTSTAWVALYIAGS